MTQMQLLIYDASKCRGPYVNFVTLPVSYYESALITTCGSFGKLNISAHQTKTILAKKNGPKIVLQLVSRLGIILSQRVIEFSCNSSFE